MPKYILSYFPIGGRAEAARLMFKVAGVEFTDVRIPFTEWGTVKGDAKRFPLSQMPTLEVDGKVICQASAIYRFLADEFGQNGSNKFEKADINQIFETLNENFTCVMTIMFGKDLTDEEKQAKYVEHFASEVTKRRFNFIIDIFKKNGGNFLIGEKLSLVDFILFAQDNMMIEKFPSYLDAFPELKKLLDGMKAVDVIKEHIATRGY